MLRDDVDWSLITVVAVMTEHVQTDDRTEHTIYSTDMMLNCDFNSSGDVCEEHLLRARGGGGGTTRGNSHDGSP